MQNKGRAKTQKTESIRADEVVILSEFQRRTGMGTHAMRNARRNGLQVRKVGLRHYVLGADWLDFVGKVGKVVGTE